MINARLITDPDRQPEGINHQVGKGLNHLTKGH